MSQQGLRQASVRAVTGTAETYEGDWHALFDLNSIPAGDFNGRFIAYIGALLGTTFADYASAAQALAEANGAYNFSSLGTISFGPVVTSYLLLEDGDFLLLEDDSKIIMG